MRDYSDEYEQKRFKADELEKSMKQKMDEKHAKLHEYQQKISEVEKQIQKRKVEERKEEFMIAAATESGMDKADRLRSFGKSFSEENELHHKKKDLERETLKYEHDMDFNINEMEKQIRTLRESARRS